MSGHIRRARRDERERITEIRFAVQENRLTDPSLVTDEDYAWFEEHPGIWVWEESGQIVGFSAGDRRDGTIWALFVDPASERRGIGRALFEAACKTLRRAGHRPATEGTKIIAVGQRRCIICASCPAPEGMRRVLSDSALA